MEDDTYKDIEKYIMAHLKPKEETDDEDEPKQSDAGGYLAQRLFPARPTCFTEAADSKWPFIERFAYIQHLPKQQWSNEGIPFKIINP